MIEIIEKEPWYDDSSTGYWMYPTYMMKNDNEYFMFNRREPVDKWKLARYENHKKQLISNNGFYFKIYGFYDNPFEMLHEIVQEKHHFTNSAEMFYSNLEQNGYLDFHGNRVEVTKVEPAFHYRIYDKTMAANIKRIVCLINKEQWDMAAEMLQLREDKNE